MFKYPYINRSLSLFACKAHDIQFQGSGVALCNLGGLLASERWLFGTSELIRPSISCVQSVCIYDDVQLQDLEDVLRDRSHLMPSAQQLLGNIGLPCLCPLRFLFSPIYCGAQNHVTAAGVHDLGDFEGVC